MTITQVKQPDTLTFQGLSDPVLIAKRVRALREKWDADYPFRERDFFSEELIFKFFQEPQLEISDLSTLIKANPEHTIASHLFRAEYGAWSFSIFQHQDRDLDWDFAVWNGAGFIFHPDEAANQILDHHSDEVFDRWRRKARTQYDVAAPILIDAAKQAIPTFSCGSATCCDSSERLMKATPGVIVQTKVAYLNW